MTDGLDDLLGDDPATADNASAALDLARHGFRVFPIRDWGDGDDWKPIKAWPERASSDHAQVAAWWRQWPDARVGLPGGADNNLAILDIDVKGGKDGLATLRSYGYDPMALSPVMVRSPSGGLHIFFAFDPRLRNWVGKLGAGIDVRTDRGFVVAPNSWKDGRRYEPIGASLGTVDLPPFPEDLVPDEIEEDVQPADAQQGKPEEHQLRWARNVFQKKLAELAALTDEGSGRNPIVNDIAMWAGGAGAHGFLSRDEVEAELLRVCRENGHATTNTKQRQTRKTIASGWKAGVRKPVANFPARWGEDLEDLDDLPMLPAPVPAVADDLADLLGEPPAPVDPGVNPDDQWSRLLDRNDETGVLRQTLHNAKVLVANDPRIFGRLGYNLLLQAVVFVRPPAALRKKPRDGKPVLQLDGAIWRLDEPSHWIDGRRWTDSHEHDLRAIIEAPKTQGGYETTVTDRNLRGAINIVANSNTFHPIRDRLRSFKWDGIPRAETLFIDYLGCIDNAYHREAARLMLLGAVARAFCPGHKFDFVPILEGSQGAGKSTFIRILGLDWSGELAVDFHDNNRMIEAMQGSWIIEIPELQGFSKAETNTLKATVSRTHDKGRLAWERNVRDFPRQCIFIASTNEDDYLRDLTGGRRFWPIHCRATKIDTDRLRGEIEQIWAEALTWFDAMRAAQPQGDLPLFMSDQRASDEAKLLQDSRRVETPDELLAAEMRAVLDAPLATDVDGEETARETVCVREVWIDLLGRDRRELDSQITTRLVGRALRLAGWGPAGIARLPKYGVQKIFRRA